MKKQIKKFPLLILVILLLLFFHFLNLKKNFRLPFIFFQEKILSGTLKIKTGFKFFSSKQQLIDENEQLKKKINELLIENKELKINKAESEIIAKQLEFLKKGGHKYLLGYVIGKTSANPLITGNLILNKGSNDGVKENFPAIVDQGFLAGKIIKVEKNISYLNIILDNQSAIAAVTENGAEGIAKGEHQLSLTLDFILPSKKVSKDELVITSGLESLIPKGLIIGKVREIKFEPGDLFQKAILEPLIDFDNLQIMSILIPQP